METARSTRSLPEILLYCVINDDKDIVNCMVSYAATTYFQQHNSLRREKYNNQPFEITALKIIEQ
eukprot:scaffold16264_cov69-Cyclotella_meneghiniana.AAC.2